MRSAWYLKLLVVGALMPPVAGSTQSSRSALQPPSAFASIPDPAERSRALFAEVAKVLTHPRCLNCHPAADRPTQGDDSHPHIPFTLRDVPCVTCHTDRNFTLYKSAPYGSIPGH